MPNYHLRQRQTCTRCSLRRQKCDRMRPCTRCVKAGESDACTIEWTGGYDPRLHRSYPTGVSDLRRRRDRSKTTSERKTGCPDALFTSVFNGNERSQALPTDPVVKQAISATCPNEAAVVPDQLTNPGVVYSPISEIASLQRLLPTSYQLLELVTYHETHVFWHHNVIHAPTFRKEVTTALQAGGGSLQLIELDMRWCALLFATLATSLACTSDSVALRMGFILGQKREMSRSYHEAAIDCLRLGDFASKPHICSCQTVQILMGSSHLLGFSNQQFVMFGSAHRIAQSLGLHRLKDDVDPKKGPHPGKIVCPVQKEVGRRVWWNMTMQDWLSIPSYDMFAIHPKHFSIPRPRSIEPDEPKELTEYYNYALDIATIVTDYHIASMEDNTGMDASSKYELVLKYDSRLRNLEPWETTIIADSPPWLKWAYSSSKVIRAHKIIIIHRHFLSKSFRDPAYTYTRWASITASKAIVTEINSLFSSNPDRPHIWITHAHLTGAGVTLCLDLMHRNPKSEPSECNENKTYIETALSLLAEASKDSVIASRGHRLLNSMLQKQGNGPSNENTAYTAIRDATRLYHQDAETVDWPISGTSASEDTIVALSSYPTGPDIAPDDFLGTNTQFGGFFEDVGQGMNWSELLAEFFPDQQLGLVNGGGVGFEDVYA